ncbi:MAG: RNA polymerase sigma factor [Planctomycetota bacterium]
MTNWESIVREHGPMAFDTAWRILGNVADTEDAVQEALLGAFRLHQQQAVTNWGGLLRHLSIRRALDRLRKRKPILLLTDESLSPCGSQPEQAAAVRELADRLRAALAKLPRREATVFSMRYFGEMSNTEIAETLHISADAVGVALHKARTKLKEALCVKENEHGRSKT